MKLIKVNAAPGLVMHFPTRTITAPGARTLKIEGDTVIEVNGDDRFVRRRLKVGDLVLVKTEKPKPSKAQKE